MTVKNRNQHVSTHSRPKAAGKEETEERNQYGVSTHSRPKAAGRADLPLALYKEVSTHSRPKAAGSVNQVCFSYSGRFQHTAARRRLGRPRR